MIDLICYNFQKEIINIFNNQEKIPFILKYYLFKEVWETIEQTKISKELQIRNAQQPQKKTLITEIPVSDEFLQNNQEEKKQQ